jgi:hypothetical protein
MNVVQNPLVFDSNYIFTDYIAKFYPSKIIVIESILSPTLSKTFAEAATSGHTLILTEVSFVPSFIYNFLCISHLIVSEKIEVQLNDFIAQCSPQFRLILVSSTSNISELPSELIQHTIYYDISPLTLKIGTSLITEQIISQTPSSDILHNLYKARQSDIKQQNDSYQFNEQIIQFFHYFPQYHMTFFQYLQFLKHSQSDLLQKSQSFFFLFYAASCLIKFKKGASSINQFYPASDQIIKHFYSLCDFKPVESFPNDALEQIKFANVSSFFPLLHSFISHHFGQSYLNHFPCFQYDSFVTVPSIPILIKISQNSNPFHLLRNYVSSQNLLFTFRVISLDHYSLKCLSQIKIASTQGLFISIFLSSKIQSHFAFDLLKILQSKSLHQSFD